MSIKGQSRISSFDAHLADRSSPLHIENQRRHRMVSAVLAALGVLSLVLVSVLVVRDSEWWCNRHAAAHLAELEAAGSSALDPASYMTSRFDKCPGGNGVHQVFFTVDDLSTREVGARFRRLGWSGTNLMTSPDGRLLVGFHRTRGPEYPGPYVTVTVFDNT